MKFNWINFWATLSIILVLAIVLTPMFPESRERFILFFLIGYVLGDILPIAKKE